jgi:hypothetical protein|tara:strand:- start:358 stop:465 length:108 start_codon:yes stop_codon:yes gene_type:complete
MKALIRESIGRKSRKRNDFKDNKWALLKAEDMPMG